MIPLSTSLSLSLLLLSAAADPINLPIVRRATRNIDFPAAADHLRAKYGYATLSSKTPPRLRRGNTANINVVNQDGDSSYFASVSIGTPAQSFNVILDTGSSDLWVTDTACTSCDPSTPLFDNTKSSSFKTASGVGSTATIRYGSGEVAGTISQDTVSMGGFTVTSQTFLAVQTTSANIVLGSVSGIMGLAFTALASTGAVPFWEALTSANQLTSPVMAFWLTRFLDQNNVSEEEPGGAFTLGGTNSTLFTGDIEFINMPSSNVQSFWLLTMQGVTVGGKSVTITTGNAALAAIDTGTTLIGGPTADVNAIWAAVPGAQAMTGNNRGYFQFPCSTDVSISLSFGGKSWPINPDDMRVSLAPGSNTQCMGAVFDLSLGSNVQPGSGNPNWVVGDTFLKNVYSVFRSSPPSIGFAQLSSAAGGSGESSPASAVPSSAGSLTGSPSPTPAPSSTLTLPSISLSHSVGTPGASTAGNITAGGVPLPTPSGSGSSPHSGGMPRVSGSALGAVLTSLVAGALFVFA